MRHINIAGPVAVAAIGMCVLTACGSGATSADTAAASSSAAAAAAASSVTAAWAAAAPSVAAAASSAAEAAAASSAADAAAASSAAGAAGQPSSPPRATTTSSGCNLKHTGDLILWEKWPGSDARASMIGDIDLAHCKYTVDTLAAEEPTGPGYCDILAKPSDNPGYDINVSPAPRPAQILTQAGADC